MQKGAHTQFDIQYHIVWITKYRKKILNMWATGYFCRTVGTVTNNIIKKNIEGQNDNIDEIFN